jgi:hypothetical protein
MANNLLPFRKPVPIEAQSTEREHGPVIFQIGRRRFALNLHVSVTEVNLMNAEILSIDKGLRRRAEGASESEERQLKRRTSRIGSTFTSSRPK